jgi:hypothetical protein
VIVGGGVGECLSFAYDREGNVLHVDLVPPYGGQESDEIDEGVVVRSNPATGAVENLEILVFSRRFEKLGDRFEVPLTGELRLLPA